MGAGFFGTIVNGPRVRPSGNFPVFIFDPSMINQEWYP